MTKYLVVLLSVCVVGCAAKPPLAEKESPLTVSEVQLTLNDIGAKTPEIVSRYPDQAELQSQFASDLNQTLAELQQKKPLADIPDVDRVTVSVKYNRNYAWIGGGVTMPTGGYGITWLAEDGSVISERYRDDIVVHGRAFLNIWDIYKVPVGQYRQEEERKYLGIWAKAIGKQIYKQHSKAAKIAAKQD